MILSSEELVIVILIIVFKLEVVVDAAWILAVTLWLALVSSAVMHVESTILIVIVAQYA